MEPEFVPKQLMVYASRGTRATGCPKPVEHRNETDQNIRKLMLLLVKFIDGRTKSTGRPKLRWNFEPIQ
jgi:hypothetical protein